MSSVLLGALVSSLRTGTILRGSLSAATPRLAPSLALDFLSGILDPRITFSRGTNAMLVDSTGRLTYAPANLLLQSQTFDNASWSKGFATITANAVVAPDGTVTADELVETTGTGDHVVFQPISFVAGVTYTATVYAKANTRTRLNIVCVSGVIFQGNFDLANGSVISTPSGTSSITSVGNGWYRCQMTATASATASGNVQFRLISSGATTSYTGDGTSGLYLWGSQVEPVTYQTTPGPYVATTASAYYGPRFDYDPVTLAPRGLLIEEARTNLLTYSEQFDNAAWFKTNVSVAANTTFGPDGTLSADTLTATAATTDGLARGLATSALAYTFSVYLKQGNTAFSEIAIIDQGTLANRVRLTYATGALTVVAGTATGTATNAGNGWWRVTITCTFPAGGAADTFHIFPGASGGAAGEFAYLWGAQLEAGAFATSYIPTVASTVSRSADVATMTGTNFSSWFNPSQGTFVVEADSVVNQTTALVYRMYAATAATASEILSGYIYDAKWGAAGMTGGVFQFDLSTVGSFTANTPAKSAMAYVANDFAVSIKGASSLTDTSGSLPTVDRLTIGGALTGNQLNGHIRSLAYYNTRLPNTQLQTLTAPSLAAPLTLDFLSTTYTVGY